MLIVLCFKRDSKDTLRYQNWNTVRCVLWLLPEKHQLLMSFVSVLYFYALMFQVCNQMFWGLVFMLELCINKLNLWSETLCNVKQHDPGSWYAVLFVWLHMPLHFNGENWEMLLVLYRCFLHCWTVVSQWILLSSWSCWVINQFFCIYDFLLL